MSVQRIMMFAAMVAIALSATVLAGSGGRSGTGSGSGSGNELKFRIPDEMTPPGGIVQMKVVPYEVTPISGGRPRFRFDSSVFGSVNGFDMFVSGELAGAAVIDGALVDVSYATNGGSTADYPILTVALRIRPDVAVGAMSLFTFDPQSVWNISPTGPVAGRIAPGTVTVGGNVSITDVVPGAGVWPAGTVVRVQGIGFNSRTRLRLNDIAIGAVRLVSPNEMQFTLAQTTEMRGVRLRAQNPEFTSTYYAYMRGITSAGSSRTLLAATEPIFSVTPRTVATFGPFPLPSAAQYAGLALQNPTLDDVAVAIALYDAAGALVYQSARTLERQHRLAMELSELLDGVVPAPGSSVVVTASAPIDAIGLVCDEAAWTVWPSLPLESQR